MDQARERLIRARAAPLDALAARLHEPRVKRVIEPVVAGSFPDLGPTFSDALSYVRDLGLIKQKPPLEVANPIYREVILRVLPPARSSSWPSCTAWSTAAATPSGRQVTVLRG